MERIVVDVASGNERREPIAPAEAEEIRAYQRTVAARLAGAAERRAAVDAIRPDAATVRSVLAGDPLTPGQVEAAVRWLIARACETGAP